MVSPLDAKLLRDLWRSTGRAALVVAAPGRAQGSARPGAGKVLARTLQKPSKVFAPRTAETVS
ncbi:hypothetical protein DRV85_14805 [Rhodosalinus halophilus]|uniref:Uncharacterized protein n=1 Tax=Rhodosalinus halophilus TaxID=2259333 RepID=A0A365U5V9_9RHOB|nr:hypothetical protein [Rhodosalinus halophilus]RBI83615.1 hypothetical protein DRV85_14805 [Rhodosalinus halophilus]